MITLKGIGDYEIMFNKIPVDELPEGYDAEATYIVPVLLGFHLKDKPENQEERARVTALIKENEAELAEQVGSKHFKLIVKG